MPTNEGGEVAGTPPTPEPHAGGPLVERVPETVKGSRPAFAAEDNQTDQKPTRSVLQQKLAKLIVFMGKLGIGLAVLTVFTLIARFMIDHFVLTDKPRLWDWLYLQSFSKYIVIGIIVLLLITLMCVCVCVCVCVL